MHANVRTVHVTVTRPLGCSGSMNLQQPHLALLQRASAAPWRGRARVVARLSMFQSAFCQQQVAAQEHLQGSCWDSHAVHRSSARALAHHLCLPLGIPSAAHHSNGL